MPRPTGLPAAIPPPPDEIELTPGQIDYALFRARGAKWGVLYRAFVAWQRLHCDLVHEPETDTWHTVRREGGTVEPPELPDREAVVLTEAEVTEALHNAQQQAWGELQAAWVSQQRRLAEQAARQLPVTPWDAGALAQWALANGRRLTGQMMPPLAFSFASQYGADMFDLLVYYFAGDEAGFLTQGQAMGLTGLSIHKSLALIGPKGVGKTLLLRTFMANPVRPFGLVTAKAVERAYREGEDGRRERARLGGLGGKHLCIDDAGTEEEMVKDFGNKEGPMTQVIRDRYDRYQAGQLPRWGTHVSSNYPLYRTPGLPADMPSWEERYGDLAVDRLKELCNIIPFVGSSRR